jgi:hypothetical protein
MTLAKHTIGVLFVLFTIGGFAGAEPAPQAQKTLKAPDSAPNEVVTRGELVTELEVILNRWEENSAQYATKSDMNSLRSILLQMREELDALNVREAEASERSLEHQQRTDNISRPSL